MTPPIYWQTSEFYLQYGSVGWEVILLTLLIFLFIIWEKERKEGVDMSLTKKTKLIFKEENNILL